LSCQRAVFSLSPAKNAVQRAVFGAPAAKNPWHEHFWRRI